MIDLTKIKEISFQACAEHKPDEWKALHDAAEAALREREEQQSESAASLLAEYQAAENPKQRLALQRRYDDAYARELNPMHPDHFAKRTRIVQKNKAACQAALPVIEFCLQFANDTRSDLKAAEAAFGISWGDAKASTSLHTYTDLFKAELHNWGILRERHYAHPHFQIHLPSFLHQFTEATPVQTDPLAASGLDRNVADMRQRRSAMDVEQHRLESEALRKKNLRLGGKRALAYEKQDAIDAQHAAPPPLLPESTRATPRVIPQTIAPEHELTADQRPAPKEVETPGIGEEVVNEVV
jgi:hypothetical protein